MADKNKTKPIRIFDKKKFRLNLIKALLNPKFNPEEEFLNRILDKVNLIAKKIFGADYTVSNEFLEALKSDKIPQEVINIYVADYFDAEVNNGGFAQFFWNSKMKFSDLVIIALKDIGAEKQFEIYFEVILYLLSMNQDDLTDFLAKEGHYSVIWTKLNKIGKTCLDSDKATKLMKLKSANIPKEKWPIEVLDFYDIESNIRSLILEYIEKNKNNLIEWLK